MAQRMEDKNDLGFVNQKRSDISHEDEDTNPFGVRQPPIITGSIFRVEFF